MAVTMAPRNSERFVFKTLYTLHPTLYTLHSALYTLHSKVVGLRPLGSDHGMKSERIMGSNFSASNSAHTRQSRPDSGLVLRFFQAKMLKFCLVGRSTCQVVQNLSRCWVETSWQ